MLLLYIRLCDSEETYGAFTVALEAKTTPNHQSIKTPADTSSAALKPRRRKE